MAGSCELQAQVRFVVASPEETATGRVFRVPDSEGVCLGVMAVFVPPGASEAERADAMRRLREECDLRAMMMRIDRNLEAVAHNQYELRKENDELKQLLADGYLKFALRVEGEDFRVFAVIMALGNRKAAAEFLETPVRTLYDRVDKWATRGKDYQKMARAVEWRKNVGRKTTVPLGDTMQSGDAGEAPENPETMKATLARLKDNQMDRGDYPALLCDILAALEGLDATNWPAVRKELIGIIKEEIPQ